MVQHLQINKCNTPHARKMKHKDHMIMSIDAKKSFDKEKHQFFYKNPQRSGNRGSIPQHNKGHVHETYSQHHTHRQKLRAFPLRS